MLSSRTLTIMRGLPGSGKSHLAAALANIPGVSPAPVFSTDDFFMVDGQYRFDGALLGKHHAANLARAVAAMEAGTPHVIIDNTNTRAWEAREYVRAALANGYRVQFIEPQTAWAKNPEECARRNSHGVPLDAIRGMLSRWEYDLTVDACLASRAPWEQ